MKSKIERKFIISLGVDGNTEVKEKELNREQVHKKIDELLDQYDDEIFVIYLRKNENQNQLNERLKK